MTPNPAMNATSPFAAVFLQEAAEQLALIEEIILDVEKNPNDAEAVKPAFSGVSHDQGVRRHVRLR